MAVNTRERRPVGRTRGVPRARRHVHFTTGQRRCSTRTPKTSTRWVTPRSSTARMSKFSNFAVSFTIISILSGCLTLYGYGLLHGGPPVMLWGWLLVGTLVHLRRHVAGRDLLRLPDRRRPVLLVGQTGARRQRPDLVLVHRLVQPARARSPSPPASASAAPSPSRRFMSILTGSATWLEPYATILILAVVLVLQGLLNTFSVRLVALLNDVSVYWHLVGVAIIFVAALLGAVLGQPPDGQLPVRQRGLEGVRGPLRLHDPALRLPHRPPERAVHVHRLRRLGARVRGDGRGAHLGAEGHRQLRSGSR